MPRRLLRFVVCAACAAVVWLVASPARASGPLCDDRGATRVAPNPALIADEQFIDVADADAPCPAHDGDHATYERHRAPEQRPAWSEVEGVVPAVDRVRAPALLGEVDATGPEIPPRSGVHPRVERPPRA